MYKRQNLYYERIAQRNGVRLARGRVEREEIRVHHPELAAVVIPNYNWRHYQNAKSRKPLSWNRHTRIKPHVFRKKKGLKEGVAYQIIELINALELKKEGVAMKHCVGSYASKCSNSTTNSIWSLRKFEGGKFYRLVTIEISNNRIVQMRGKMNSTPLMKYRNVISKWAEKQGIQGF